jgi:hypothetical protein
MATKRKQSKRKRGGANIDNLADQYDEAAFMENYTPNFNNSKGIYPYIKKFKKISIEDINKDYDGFGRIKNNSYISSKNTLKNSLLIGIKAQRVKFVKDKYLNKKYPTTLINTPTTPLNTPNTRNNTSKNATSLNTPNTRNNTSKNATSLNAPNTRNNTSKNATSLNAPKIRNNTSKLNFRRRVAEGKAKKAAAQAAANQAAANQAAAQAAQTKGISFG